MDDESLEQGFGNTIEGVHKRLWGAVGMVENLLEPGDPESGCWWTYYMEQIGSLDTNQQDD